MKRLSIQFAVPPSGIRLRGPGTATTTEFVPAPPPAPVVTPAHFPAASAPPPSTEAESRRLLESITAAIGEIEARRQQSLGELQHVAIELAVAVASQLVFTAIERDQFAVEELVRQAVQEMGMDGPLSITLHPADLKLLQKQLAGSPSNWKTEFKPDPGIARGGCRAESPDGKMLISEVTSRLSEIRRHWMEELDDAQIERRRTAGEGPPLRRFPDRRETA